MRILALGLLSIVLIWMGCSMTETIIKQSSPLPVDGIVPPRIASAPEVEYPDVGTRLEIEGVVYVKTIVRKDGHADSAQVIKREFNFTGILQTNGTVKPVGEVFDPLALKFVNAVVFEPALKNGQPVEVWILVPVRWVLRR